MHPKSTTSLLRQFIAAPERCVRCPRPIYSSYSSVVTLTSSNVRLSAVRSVCTRHNPANRRTFLTSSPRYAAVAQRVKADHAELVTYPTSSSLQQEEVDEDDPELELVPPEEARLELTDRAAEQLRSIAQRESNAEAALRVAVESGGCHGYQYKMELARKREPDDYHFSHPRIKPSNIYVDAVSMTLLKGSTVDFATELIGSSFRVVDNPQSKGSGCGCGVSWELKV